MASTGTKPTKPEAKPKPNPNPNLRLMGGVLELEAPSNVENMARAR